MCCRRAHPRSRGENRQGSLFRGPVDWLIPAHAGKTEGVLCHECGKRGSSPLTRGKHLAAWIAGVTPGLIPAHAGKTAGTGRPTRRARAHPRSRGENLRAAWRPSAVSGSSPLTRGKLPQAAGHHAGRGLIPAHAGKTKVEAIRLPSGRAHPRSRGENGVLWVVGSAVRGSSPLTRGKPGPRS